MDTKELNNLIDRISLTGPEGIKKIKKVLKELSNGSSSGSMGEDEEYTIARALNDLNERIGELQSQVAQRDYFEFLVASLEEPTEQDLLGLQELYKRGVIYNAIIVEQTNSTVKQQARVIGAVAENDELKRIYLVFDGAIVDIAIS